MREAHSEDVHCGCWSAAQRSGVRRTPTLFSSHLTGNPPRAPASMDRLDRGPLVFRVAWAGMREGLSALASCKLNRLAVGAPMIARHAVSAVGRIRTPRRACG